MSDPVLSVVIMKIDCETCTARGPACTDCVVSFLTIEVRPTAVVVDDDQAAAMRTLSQAGLVPPLRLVNARGLAS